MTLTVDKLLSDAKQLVKRLQEKDGETDTLIGQADGVSKRIKTMKEYDEETAALNVVSRHKSRATLVLSLVYESKQIKMLKQENEDLSQCLEDYQSALELIMKKYREQIKNLMNMAKMDKTAIIEKLQSNDNEVQQRVEQVDELVAVMQKAALADDEHFNQCKQTITQLHQENTGLRELLHISNEIGAGLCNIHAKADCSTQTDETVADSLDESKLSWSHDDSSPNSSHLCNSIDAPVVPAPIPFIDVDTKGHVVPPLHNDVDVPSSS